MKQQDFVSVKNIQHLAELLSADGIEFRCYPGKPLTLEQKCSRLFHYTKFETFSKYIWPDRRLKPGEICNVNDLFERYKSISSSSPTQVALMYAFDVLRNQYRQISFTMDYDSFKEGCMSPLMWAYYAESTNGVCIEFNPQKIHFTPDDLCKPINYIEGPSREIIIPSTVRSLNDLKSFILDNIDAIFFTKSNDWDRENEYKVLTKQEFVNFDEDAITCVYVTSFDSETCLKVEEIVGDKIPVKYFYLDKNSLPHVADTKNSRNQFENAQNSKTNFLNAIHRKAEETYLRLKDNADADLSIDQF